MADFDEETTEAHEKRITRCSAAGCRARIVWLKTKAGKNMPVDADTVEPEHTEFDQHAGHISHFSTCTRPDRFRRR